MRVHLPDENYITYNSEADMSRIVSQEFLRKTMLIEWFIANQRYPDARTLSYCDFPSKWRWNEITRTWERRQRGVGKIGRIYFMHPSVGERYYLRMLLLIVKDLESYESLQTYNTITYATFKEACNARGLLNNDQEWYNAFDEAASWATSNQIRQLFVTMLLFCEVGDEYMFFQKIWKLLTDDIEYNIRQVLNHPTYQMSENDLQDHLLDTLGDLLNRRGRNINDFNLPRKSTITTSDSSNRLFDEELSYNADALMSDSENMISQLNNDQHYAFDCIVHVVLKQFWIFFCFWKKIVLSMTSSRVASLLLLGGWTAHSRFKIPCDNLYETTTCNIKRGTMLCELIQAASLIIWDEALMTHRIAFEALDRALSDLLSLPSFSKNNRLPFSGKVVILGGDLRQTLPVIEGGSQSEIVNSAIVNSSLWSHVVVLHLRINMRLSTDTLTEQGRKELADFSRWLLDIGEGNMAGS
jgi:hypothetical protein